MIGRNNIFNIRNSTNSWVGQIGQTRGFCDFTTESYCIRAAGILLLRSYRKKGYKTIDSIIHRFAPPVENDTSAYISFVSEKADIAPFEELSTRFHYCRVLSAMAKMETGKDISAREIFDVLRYFKINLVKK